MRYQNLNFQNVWKRHFWEPRFSSKNLSIRRRPPVFFFFWSSLNGTTLVFIRFAISVLHPLHPETTRSISKHTRNTPLFTIAPTVRRTPYSVWLQFFVRFLRELSPSSQSVALCIFFVTWSQRCVCELSIGGSLFLICSWLLWLSNHLTKKKNNKKENVV